MKKLFILLTIIVLIMCVKMGGVLAQTQVTLTFKVQPNPNVGDTSFIRFQTANDSFFTPTSIVQDSGWFAIIPTTDTLKSIVATFPSDIPYATYYWRGSLRDNHGTLSIPEWDGVGWFYLRIRQVLEPPIPLYPANGTEIIR